jgi:hypothetical protein
MALVHFHWDFFGADALPTAEHFCKHVQEFCAAEGITEMRTWTTEVKMRSIASLECDEQYLPLVRDRLRPRRAERPAGVGQ